MTIIDVLDSEETFKVCPRCSTVSDSRDTVCAPCGLTFGPRVHIETATRVRLLDALVAGDLDELIRLTLEAHADGLIEVAQ